MNIVSWKKNTIYFLIALLGSIPLWWGANLFQKNLQNSLSAQVGLILQHTPQIEANHLKPEAQTLNLKINSRSALSVWTKKGGNQIILQSNPSQKLPIASLTKLMSAVVVLENPQDYSLTQKVPVSQNAAKKDKNQGYGNLSPGDNYSVNSLLNMMLIESSNDAALALAEIVGVQNFVHRMNLKAKELQMSSTHFVNPSGLDPEEIKYNSSTIGSFNHSSCSDLVKLTTYILDNYPQIFGISVYQNKIIEDLQGEKHLTVTRNKVLNISPHISGQKTGYTSEAGGCALTVLQKEKKVFINVILGTESQQTRFEQMEKLIKEIEQVFF